MSCMSLYLSVFVKYCSLLGQKIYSTQLHINSNNSSNNSNSNKGKNILLLLFTL